MAEHTPGPWMVEDLGMDTGPEDEYLEYKFMIGSMFVRIRDVYSDDEEQRMRADLRLIAASPDLLKACEDFVTWINMYGENRVDELDAVVRQNLAAIAKAKAKSD